MIKLSVGEVVDLQFGLKQLRDLSNEKNSGMSVALRYKTFILIDKSKEPIVAFEKVLTDSLRSKATEIMQTLPGSDQMEGTNKWRFNSLDARKEHEEGLDKLRKSDSNMNVSVTLSMMELLELKVGSDALVSLKPLIEDDMSSNNKSKEPLELVNKDDLKNN